MRLSVPRNTLSIRSVSVVLVAACALGVAFATPASAAAPKSATITPTAISLANLNGGGWFPDTDAGPKTGVVQIATRVANEDPSLSLSLVAANDNATLQYRAAAANRLTDSSADNFNVLRTYLSNASYTYTGKSVNYQLGIYYKPLVSKYSPTGDTPCASAGIDSPSTWCYTTIKYEPAKLQSAFVTVDVSSTFDKGLSSLTDGVGGWWRSKSVGQYPTAGAPDGVSLNSMLAEMSDITVYGIGVSVGRASAGDVSWVKDLAFGDTDYSFGFDALPAGPLPVADDAALAVYIAAHGLTPNFPMTPSGSSNTDLATLDPSKPLSGSFDWSGLGDDFVDLYSYSVGSYVGTYPVVAGKVVISGASLASLAGGQHHLVFVGQTSKTVRITAITVKALAATGVDATGPIVAGSVLLIGGFVLFMSTQVTRRRRARA
jgi:hypothetical protein